MDNKFITADKGFAIIRQGSRVTIVRTEPDNTLDGRDDVVIANPLHDEVLVYDEVDGIWKNKARTFKDTNTVYQLELVQSEFGAQFHLIGSDDSVNIVEFEMGTGVELRVELGQLRISQVMPVTFCSETDSIPALNRYVLVNTGIGPVVETGRFITFIPTFDNTGPASIVIKETSTVYPIVRNDGSPLSANHIRADFPYTIFYDNGQFYLDYEVKLAHNTVGMTENNTFFYFTGNGEGALSDLYQVGRDVLKQTDSVGLGEVLGVVPKSGGKYTGPVSFKGSPTGIGLPLAIDNAGSRGAVRFNPNRQSAEGRDSEGWTMLLTEEAVEAQPRIVTQKPYVYSGNFDIALPGAIIVEPFAVREYTIRMNRVDSTGYTNSNVMLSGDTFTILETVTSSGTIIARFSVVTDVQLIGDYYEFRAEIVEDTPDWVAPPIGLDVMVVTVFVRGTGLDEEIASIRHDNLKRINTPGGPYQHITEAERDRIGVVNSATVVPGDDPINDIVVTNSQPDPDFINGVIPDGYVLTINPLADSTNTVTVSMDGGAKAFIFDPVVGDWLGAGGLSVDTPVKIYWEIDHWVLMPREVYVPVRQHNTLLDLNTGIYQHLTPSQKDLIGKVTHLNVTGATSNSVTITPTMMNGMVDVSGNPVDGLIISFVAPMTNTEEAFNITFGGSTFPLHRNRDVAQLGVGGIIHDDIVTVVFDAINQRWILEQVPMNPDVKTNRYIVSGTGDAIVLTGTVPNAIVFNGEVANNTVIEFIPTQSNTGATTIQIDGGVISSLTRNDGSELLAGDLTIDVPVTLRWIAGSSKWQLDSMVVRSIATHTPVDGTTFRQVTDNTMDSVMVSDISVPLLASNTQAELRAAIGDVGDINYYTLTGDANNWIVTPRLSAFAMKRGEIPDNFLLEIVSAAENTGAMTLTFGEVTLPIQFVAGVDVPAATILANKGIQLTYQGTHWMPELTQTNVTTHSQVRKPNSETNLQHLTAAQMALLTEINKYTVETDNGNELVITHSIPDVELLNGVIPNGFLIKFIPTMNNTGPVTIDFGTLVNSPLVSATGSPLVADTLIAGELAIISWKVDKWYFNEPKVNVTPHDELRSLNQGEYLHATTEERSRVSATEVIAVAGSDTQYDLTTNFPYAFIDEPMPDGYIVDFVPTVTNGENATISFNGSNPLPLMAEDGTPLAGGILIIGRGATIAYRLTHWVYIQSGLGMPAHNSLLGLDVDNYQHLTAEERTLAGKTMRYQVSGVDALVLTSLSGYAFRDGLSNDTVLEFIAVSTNTGAMTIDIDGMGAVPLLMPDGQPVSAGYILEGDHVLIRYDEVGTSWLIDGKKPNLSKTEFYKVTGNGNAIVLTSSVNKLSITIGGVIPNDKIIEFLPIADNTGATTVNLDARGVIAINDDDGNALLAGMIKKDRLCRIQWRGSTWILENPVITQLRAMEGAAEHTLIGIANGDLNLTVMRPAAQDFNALETAAEMRQYLGVADTVETAENDTIGEIFTGVASGASISAYRAPGRIGWGYHAELLKKNAVIDSSVNMVFEPYTNTPLAYGNEIIENISEYRIAINEFDTLTFTAIVQGEILNDYPLNTNTSWTSLNGWVLTTDGNPIQLLHNINDGSTYDTQGNYYAEERGRGIIHFTIEFPEPRFFKSMSMSNSLGFGPTNNMNVHYVDANGNILYTDIDCQGGTWGGGSYYNCSYYSRYEDLPIKKLIFENDSSNSSSTHKYFSTMIAEITAFTTIAQSGVRTLLFADGNYYAIGIDVITLIGPEPDWEQGVSEGIINNSLLVGFTDAKLELEVIGTIDVTYNGIQPQIAIQSNGNGIAQITRLDDIVFDDGGTGIKMFISKDGIEYFTMSSPGVFTSVGTLSANSQSAILIMEQGFDKTMLDATDPLLISEWLGVLNHTADMVYWAYGTNNPAAVIKSHTLSGELEGGYTVQPSVAFTYFPDRVVVAVPSAGDFLININ